jgi:mannosyltransferase
MVAVQDSLRKGALVVVNPVTAGATPEVTTAPPGAVPRSAPRWLAWAVPTAVTAALGLYQINVPILWRDELATWSAASRTLPQLWAMVHNVDAVLGLYYLGLHLWMAVFGDSAAALRLPSALAMTGAAAVVALTGKRLGGTRAGLISGLIFAVIPSVSRFAQEARPYAFATLFAALATLLLLRAMERPTWLRWGCYTLALAAVGASNLIALCVLAAHAAIVATDFCLRTVRIADEDAADGGRALPGGRPEPAQGRPLALLGWFSLAAIIGVILDAPVVLEGHAQSTSQIGQQPVPHVAALFGVIDGLWPELFASTPVALAVIALALASVVTLAGARQRVLAGYALAGGILPIVAVWLVSQGPDSYWTFRYMLFTVPAWAVAAGLGVAGAAERLPQLSWARLRLPRLAAAWRPGYAAVAAALVVVVAALGVHDQLDIRKPLAHNAWAFPVTMANGEPVDYRAAAAVIAANQRPGDGIVYQVDDQNHYEVDAAIGYYLRGKSIPKAVFQAETPAQADALQPVECADPSTCITGYPRIWVVYVDRLAGSPLDPFSGIPADEAGYLEILGYQTQALYSEDGITVALLTVG